jgi:DNA invertase Pin-like site-specific DNA recombinase
MPDGYSKEPVPAVTYYRCSSSQQDLSVGEQRSVVESYAAAKGYRIIREYVDEGKSASKNQQKRVAFNRMVADSTAQNFSVVLCYDASRFTRFDNIEGSTPKQVLRTNGVILVTTKEGEFDWRVPEGRWKDMAYCEANRALALNLSKDSIRGRLAIIAKGFWPNGVVPYGYDREYTDGIHTQFVPRYERFKKGRNWHLRLVINEAEAAVVREVFDMIVNRLWSRRQIAIHLTARKIPPARGQNGLSDGAWDGDNVLAILKEKAYKGVASIGGGRRCGAAHNRTGLAELANACPPLVEPHVWRQAQEIIKGRRDQKARPQPGRGGVLSGFILCGHCGYRLSKHSPAREKGVGVYYCCTSAAHRPHLGCHNYRVREEAVLPDVCRWLLLSIDAEMLDVLQARPPEDDGRPAEEALLTEQVKALETRAANAAESALLAPPSARETAWALVGKWQGEVEEARQRLNFLRAVRNAPELMNFGIWWSKVKGDLVKVRDAVAEKFDPPRLEANGDHTIAEIRNSVYVERDRLRALLGRLGCTVRVWFEKNEGRRRQREPLYVVKDARIEASVDLESFLSGNSTTTSRGWRRLPPPWIHALFCWPAPRRQTFIRPV